MHSNRNHPKPLAAVMSSEPHTPTSRLRSQWLPCFTDCLFSSPVVFKGINRQLANYRADWGCAQLSNSLRLLTTAALLFLSEVLVAYICRHSTRLEIRRHQLCQQSAAQPWGATSAYSPFISTSTLCWFCFWWEYKSGTDTVSYYTDKWHQVQHDQLFLVFLDVNIKKEQLN